MKISELQGILSKASQLLGDAPIVFKDAESEAETAFKAIEVEIKSSDPSDSGTVTVVHTAPSTVPASDPTPAVTAPDAGSSPA